jgi:GntR family transcriptional repressor for pyruvate dehydrogenase complex
MTGKMMDDSKNMIILKAVQDAGMPVGASYLSGRLSIPPASIGRAIAALEKKRYVRKVSNKGRIITEEGEAYLRRKEQESSKEQSAEQLIRMVAEADKETMLEIMETRKLLEGYSARKAGENASDQEIADLENLIFEHIHSVRNGSLGSQLDLEIHLKIAQMSGNQVIYQTLKILLTSHDAYNQFSLASEQIRNGQIRQHDAILKAIQSHNPQEAEAAMEDHLNHVMDDVRQYFQ